MKAREFSRIDRVSATIKRVLASSVADIARQAGAGMVTITRVDISPDMRRAAIHLSIYADGEHSAILKRYSERASELQAVLGREMRTKRTPVLSFRLDDAIEREDRISRLLNNAEASGGDS